MRIVLAANCVLIAGCNVSEGCHQIRRTFVPVGCTEANYVDGGASESNIDVKIPKDDAEKGENGSYATAGRRLDGVAALCGTFGSDQSVLVPE